MGISQGGMIAQWLAADFPEKVQAHLVNDHCKLVLSDALALVQSGNFRIMDIAKHSYTQRAIKSGSCFIISWVA